LNREIYGEDIEVRFVRYLRPEKKFATLDALADQIAADVREAREGRQPNG
jgi:riboflavin kinase/FMN adenylyltransferase